MKKILTLAIVFLLILPTFSVILPKVEGDMLSSEQKKSTFSTGFTGRHNDKLQDALQGAESSDPYSESLNIDTSFTPDKGCQDPVSEKEEVEITEYLAADADLTVTSGFASSESIEESSELLATAVSSAWSIKLPKKPELESVAESVPGGGGMKSIDSQLKTDGTHCACLLTSIVERAHDHGVSSKSGLGTLGGEGHAWISNFDVWFDDTYAYVGDTCYISVEAYNYDAGWVGADLYVKYKFYDSDGVYTCLVKSAEHYVYKGSYYTFPTLTRTLGGSCLPYTGCGSQDKIEVELWWEDWGNHRLQHDGISARFSVLAHCWFHGVGGHELDKNGDGYYDGVECESMVWTDGGTMTVTVKGYLYDMNNRLHDSGSKDFTITDKQYVWLYGPKLYVDPGGPVGKYRYYMKVYDKCTGRLEDTTLNQYIEPLYPPDYEPPGYLYVEATNLDDDDHRVKIYVDGSYWRSIDVPSGDTETSIDKEVDAGYHTVKIKWHDDDTDEWYSHSSGKNVDSNRWVKYPFDLEKHLSPLRVQVKNIDGTAISGAEVHLWGPGGYGGSYRGYKTTDSNGYTGWWSDLPDGNYVAEVEYPSPAALGYLEFWGANEFYVSGPTTFYFTRHTQWAYEVKINGQYVPTSIEICPEEKIHVDVTVKNSESVSKNVKVTIILDRSKSSPWDFEEEHGPKNVGSNSYGYFGWDYYPSESGTYYVYVIVKGYYNGKYIVTDQWDWTKAFVVKKPDATIVDFDVEEGTFYPGDIVQAQAMISNDGPCTYTFLIDYAIRDSDGHYWGVYNENREISVGTCLILDEELDWEVPDDAAEGQCSGRLLVLDPSTGEEYDRMWDHNGPTIRLPQWTLTVYSAHDTPDPPNGDHYYDDGESVTCSVTSPVTEGDMIWTCTGWTGTGSVPLSGTGTSVTFTITQDSSITWNWEGSPIQRKLTVYSAHDSPDPANGDHFYDHGTLVTARVTSPVTEGSTIWTCTGWVGSGSVPASGTGASVSFTITQDSSLTWIWQGEFYPPYGLGDHDDGGVLGGMPGYEDNDHYSGVDMTTGKIEVYSWSSARAEDDPFYAYASAWAKGELGCEFDAPLDGTYEITMRFRVKGKLKVTGVPPFDWVVASLWLRGYVIRDGAEIWKEELWQEAIAWWGIEREKLVDEIVEEAFRVQLQKGVYHMYGLAWARSMVWGGFWLPGEALSEFREDGGIWLEEIDIRFVHPEGDTGSLTVSVFDSSGGPVEEADINALVIYQDAYSNVYEIVDATSIISESYTWTALPVGHNYLVEAYVNDMYSGSTEWVTLNSPVSKSTTVTVNDPGFLKIKATYSNNVTPLSNAYVEVTSHSGTVWRSDSADLNGETSWFLLQPTTKPGEYYKAYVYYDGEPVGESDLILLDSDSYQIKQVTTDLGVATLRVEALSPVNIMVTDPSGARIGYDPVTGEVVNEIPGATYSGPGTEPQEIIIHNPIDGAYTVDAFGTGLGTFTITMGSFDRDGLLIDSKVWTGTAEPEEQYTQEVEVEPDGNITDATPPITTETTVTPTTTTVNPTLTATVTDVLSTVIAAEYFIDTTGTSGTGIPLSAIDGAFDELSEDVIATISISELSQGEHTVYVHGKDSADNWGDFDSCTFAVIKTYSLTVEASPSDASGGNFLVTYTLNEVTYTDEEHTTSWTTEVDVDSTVTISSPQEIIDKIPDDGTRYSYVAGAGTFTMDSDKIITLEYNNQYFLTMSTNFGPISPSSGWFDAGTKLTIEAEVPSVIEGEQYVWLGWTGTGDVSYSGMNNPAIDAVTMNGPVTETASWRHEFCLTITTNFGTTDPTGGEHWYEAGTVIEISATPPSTITGEQYIWNGWSGTGSGSYSGMDNPSSVTMNDPITEIASWTHQFYLEIEVVNEVGTDISSVVSILGQAWYDAGTEIDLTAPQDVEFAIGSRYDFGSWTGDVSSTANTISIIMTAPTAVTANYMTQYYLTVNNGGHGTASGEGWYDSGVLATFSISPTIVYDGVGTRYVFTQWSGDSTSTSPSDTILMDGPKMMTANWKTQYQVTFEQTGSGATTYVTYISDTDPIEAVPFNIWAKTGSTLTFSYDEIVNDGQPTRYVLVSVDKTSPLTVNEPVTITATYKTQHYLTLGHLPIDPILDGHQTGQGYYDADSIATVTADQYVDIVAGSSQYMLDHWSGDASGTSTTTTIIMSAPKTATANYKIQYYITVTSTHDSPTPSAWVDAGSDFTASVASPTEIVPNDHQWVCTSFSVDGGAYQTGTYYTFINVKAAHRIDFAWKKQFWIQVNSPHDSPTPSQWIDQGGSLTVSVTSPADDDGMGTRYRCTGYTLDSTPPVVDRSTSYTFENVQAAHTITFNWIAQYRLTVMSDHDSPDPAVGEHWYDTATTITATVTSPADESNGIRYRATGWTGTGSVPVSEKMTSVTFTINMPSTLTWNWVIQYKLTVESDHNAPIPSVGEHWYDSGTSILASVSSPADDDGMGTRYRCTGWTLIKDSITTSCSEISVSFSIDTPSILTWNWFAQYYLTTSTNFGEVSPLSSWYDTGTEVTILATSPDVIPNERYVWNGWFGTGTGSYNGLNNPATITINSPISETASWTHQYYIIIISAHDSPTPSDWVDQGSDFTASVTSPAEVVPCDQRWVCTGFNVDGGLAQPRTSYTFSNVQAPHTITFNWKKQFWIQVNSDHDNPTPSGWVDQGGSFTASVTSPADVIPDYHQWVCSGFSIDSGELQPGTSYIFVNVQTPHTIVFSWWQQFWVTLTYTGDTTVQYSDPAIVSATLIVTETGQPLQGRTITFTIGTQSATATTNEQGIAATTITLNQPASDSGVTIEFTGDTVYLPRTVEEEFTITKENATVDYTGDTVVPTTANTINLRATIFDDPDNWWGDLTKIQVIFKIYTFTDLVNPIFISDPISVTQTETPGVGVAIESIENLDENGYIIIVSINENGYYRGPTSDPTALTVYAPTGEFVTGGGWILDPSGSKGNFGFNVKYTKSGKPKGHSIYVYREGEWAYIVKSNAWIGLAIESEENHAYFEAKCVVQKYNPATGELVWDEGNYKFRVDVWDYDADGGVDTYQIRVLDKNGVLFHEAGFDPFGYLQGGNIVIHNERKKKP